MRTLLSLLSYDSVTPNFIIQFGLHAVFNGFLDQQTQCTYYCTDNEIRGVTDLLLREYFCWPINP